MAKHDNKRARVDDEELLLRHEMATRTMSAEGWPDEPWDLSRADRSAFFERYGKLVRGDVDVASTN